MRATTLWVAPALVSLAHVLPDRAAAFVDNLHDVPAFSTDGRLDLVVPADAFARDLEPWLASNP